MSGFAVIGRLKAHGGNGRRRRQSHQQSTASSGNLRSLRAVAVHDRVGQISPRCGQHDELSDKAATARRTEARSLARDHADQMMSNYTTEEQKLNHGDRTTDVGRVRLIFLERSNMANDSVGGRSAP